MGESVLNAAADLLAEYYGSIPPVGPSGEWTTLVRVVLASGRKLQKSIDWDWIDDTVLRSADETAAGRRDSLGTELESTGYAANKAASLLALAQWWLRRIGPGSSTVDEWNARRDRWCEELRELPGVNWELADRILLFVGGVTAIPLDRGTMRVAARHGWVETTADYDEWQSFFVRGLFDAGIDIATFSQAMSRIGRDFCGKVPRCDACPLRSLLPPGGPNPIDGTEGD